MTHHHFEEQMGVRRGEPGSLSDALGKPTTKLMPGHCGCRAWFDDNETTIHIEPCCPQHSDALERAARDLTEQLGIPLEIDEDQP